MSLAFKVGSRQYHVSAEGSVLCRDTDYDPWRPITRLGMAALVAMIDAEAGTLDMGFEVSVAAPHIPAQWKVGVTSCPVDFDAAVNQLADSFIRVYPRGAVRGAPDGAREAVLLDHASGATLLLTEQSDASWPPAQRGQCCAVHVANMADLGFALAALHRASKPGNPAILKVNGTDDMQVDSIDLQDKAALRAFLEEHERMLDQLDYCNRAGLLAHCRIDLSALLGAAEPVVDF